MNATTSPITLQIVFPPALVEDRPETDWLGWVANRMQGETDKKGLPFKMPKAETISGQLILSHAPIWAQAEAIRQAIAGELGTPAAQELRGQFLRGAPLSLLPAQCAETFRNFVPVITRTSDDAYQVGLPPDGNDIGLPIISPRELAEYEAMDANERQAASYEWPNCGKFKAPSPEKGLDWGRCWFLARRNAEIEALLEQARETSRSLGQLIRAVLAGRLKRHGKLLAAPAEGETVAVVYANGAHDRYIVEGDDYLYGFTASAPVAAVVGAMTAKGRGLRIPKPGDDDVISVAPDDWRKGSGEVAYAWKGGEMKRSGEVKHDGKPKGQLVWKSDLGKFNIMDPKNKRLESLPQPEKPSELLLAWGVAYLIEKK